jgi:hypothetical protein
LIRDFTDALATRILDIYTQGHPALHNAKIGNEISRLGDSVKEILVVESVEEKDTSSSKTDRSGGIRVDVKGSVVGPSLGGFAEGKAQSGRAIGSERIVKGFPQTSVRIGSIYGAMRSIAEYADCRIWILLDEWSTVPTILQPYLADIIRRALIPVQNVTVQIAAIEHRSQFRIDQDGNRIGFELGSDIAGDIHLDDFFVYDLNPEPAVKFFKDLVFKHLTALSEDGEFTCRNPQEVISQGFTQEKVFSEIVRACEGVPRDFINIIQLAAMRAKGEKISMPDVEAAAKDWYERDKAINIDTNPRAQQLLEWIIREVISRRKCRAFMLEIDKTSRTIDFLFDERILHIAKRSYSTKDRAGVRYRLWKIDYGCYVDLMNTTNAPENFIDLEVENPDKFNFEVPADDFRAMRRAILDIDTFNSTHPRQTRGDVLLQ